MSPPYALTAQATPPAVWPAETTTTASVISAQRTLQAKQTERTMIQTGDSECRSAGSSGQAESRPGRSSWFVAAGAARSTGASPDGVGGPPRAFGGSAGSKPGFLGLGSAPLEAFLVELEGCTGCNAWSAVDGVCRIIAGLEGPAWQVLCDVDDGTADAELISVLKNRFGGAGRVEQHGAALRAGRGRSWEVNTQVLHIAGLVC